MIYPFGTSLRLQTLSRIGRRTITYESIIARNSETLFGKKISVPALNQVTMFLSGANLRSGLNAICKLRIIKRD